MNFPDSARLSAGAIAAMRGVAEVCIMPRYMKLASTDITTKTHAGDMVTIADLEAERALSGMLGDLLPGSRVIGEEATAADELVLDHLKEDYPVWIIDPIDGTSNFVHGVACFAVMVALVRRGQTLMGFIHDPVTGRTLWAEKGQGAWLETGGGTKERIQDISAPARVTLPPHGSDAMADLTAGLYNRDLVRLKGKFARIVRLGSAAHDYWSLTDGRMHVLSFKGLKPWDHAAGLLIHEEAGGFNRLLSGREYSPAVRDQVGVLCTPTREIWRSVVDAAEMAERNA